MVGVTSLLEVLPLYAAPAKLSPALDMSLSLTIQTGEQTRRVVRSPPIV
jgi:hypothetical protein